MINVNSLNQAITALRAETQMNAISPNSLGGLLQTISNLLATATTESDIASISQLQAALNNLKQKVNAYVIHLQNDPTYISHLVQGATDRNNVYLNATKVNVAFGTAATVEQAVTIKQATETRAGVMRAQQVTDLNNAKADISALQTSLRQTQVIVDEIQSLIEEIASAVTRQYHIECKINRQSGLHITGANTLVRDGYVPYIFRYSRKKSRYRHNRTEQRRKGPKMRGWHVFCGKDKIKFIGNDLMKISSHNGEGAVTHDYSSSPENLFSGYSVKEEDDMVKAIYVTYGSDHVDVKDGRHFRFAVAFSRPQTGSRFDFTKLVTNLAEFRVFVRTNPNTQSLWIDYLYSR